MAHIPIPDPSVPDGVFVRDCSALVEAMAAMALITALAGLHSQNPEHSPEYCRHSDIFTGRQQSEHFSHKSDHSNSDQSFQILFTAFKVKFKIFILISRTWSIPPPTLPSPYNPSYCIPDCTVITSPLLCLHNLTIFAVSHLLHHSCFRTSAFHIPFVQKTHLISPKLNLTSAQMPLLQRGLP